MGILDQCQEYFDTRDVYKLFELPKDASASDIKKAYYKLSLQVHPDRVNDKEKTIATEKFKVLSTLYQVLSDKEKRAIYDEQGTINDEDDYESKLTSWLDLWRKLFKPITDDDIENYKTSYIGSELERTDIKKAYVRGKGCINYLFGAVPFLQVEDEPRLQKIVREMIDANEVEEYKIFTNEPAQKRNRRHKKYAREAKLAEEIEEKRDGGKKAKNKGAASGSGDTGDLAQQLMERRQARESNYDNFMDKLLQKYGGDEDDGDVIDFNKLDKNSKKKKKQVTGKKKTSEEKLNTVKNGKVKKRGA